MCFPFSTSAQKPFMDAKEIIDSHELSAIPFDERKWNFWHYLCLWLTIAATFPVIFMAVPMFNFGLLWWQILIVLAISQTIAAFYTALVGKTGSKYGIPFIVSARAAFGIKGAVYIGFIRLVLAIFGYAAFVYCGAMMLNGTLSLWNAGLQTIDSPFPESWKIDCQHLICYGIVWLMHLPVAFLGVRGMRYTLVVNAIVSSLFLLVLTVYVSVTVTNPGPLLAVPAPKFSIGTFFMIIFSSIALYSGYFLVFASSFSDFARHSESNNAPIIGTLASAPVAFTVVPMMGLVLMSKFMDRFGQYQNVETALLSINSPAFAVFATIFTLFSTICANWAINSVSGGLVFVSYWNRLNTRLGGFLVALLALFIYPAMLLVQNALNPGQVSVAVPGQVVDFYNSLKGLAVLMAPVIGIMLADYILVNDYSLDVEELSFPVGRYWYSRGFNWRAFGALLIGYMAETPSMFGLFNAFGQSSIFEWDIVYGFVYFCGFLFAGGAYWAVMTAWPPRLYGDETLELTPQSPRYTIGSHEEKDNLSLVPEEGANVLGI